MITERDYRNILETAREDGFAEGEAAAYTEGLAASEVLPLEDGAGGYCPGVFLAVLDIERVGE